MKTLTLTNIFLINSIICQYNPYNQYYWNLPSDINDSLYNPQSRFTPQDQSIPKHVPIINEKQKANPSQQAQKEQIEANNSENVRFDPQSPGQQSINANNLGYKPSNPQNPEQQLNAIGPPFSLEQISQVAERASQLQLEEVGYAMTDTEKQEITNELILAQDQYISGDLDNEGGMNEYNRLFRFGNPFLGAGFSLAGAALKGLSGGRGDSSGMGGIMGMGGSGSSPFKHLGKAIAPHVANKFKGERSSPGEYVDSFFNMVKFFNGIFGQN